MALFTDGEFISQADMQALDSEVNRLGAADGMSFTTAQGASNGILAQACDEMGRKIIADSQSVQGYMTPWAVPYNQAAAVLNATLPSVNRPRISLSQVVVSSVYPGYSSSIKQCTLYYALWILFRNALRRVASGKDSDRYQAKMMEYDSEIKRRYYPRFYNEGVPVVYKPLACPGATHEPGAGTFDTTRLSLTAGTNGLGTTTYYVATTWTDSAQGYVSSAAKGTGESGPSATVPISVTTNNVIQVDITPLKAPDGSGPANVATGLGLFIKGNATGWNVYVGTAATGPLYLQNATPVAIATKTYALAGVPTTTGAQMDVGQAPQALYTMSNSLARG